MPEKLHELQRLWLIEATRYNVLPIDDRVVEKMNPDTAGRPVLIKGKTQLLFGGMGRLSENCVLNIKNKSHSVTAEIEVPTSGAEGVIIAQGANIGGWSLYAKNGKLKYCYNVAGVNHYYVEAARALPAGEHQVRMEFAYAGATTAATSARTAAPPSPRTTARAAMLSTERSRGCSSPSATRPKARIISSRRRTRSASPWHASNRIRTGDGAPRQWLSWSVERRICSRSRPLRMETHRGWF
jgi:hypothetical protein